MSRRAISVVFVAAIALAASREAGAQLLSPGKLSNAHSSLDGDDQCSSCHTSGKKLSSSKCLACHKALGRRISAGAGLHGRNYKGKACSSCHVEHIGRKGRLVRWPGGGKDKLNHSDTGWALQGGHSRVTCNKCHTKRNKSGGRTYLGLSTTCKTCHKDPHKNRFGSKCKDCHSESSWKKVDMKAFDHSRTRFPLKGKHSSVGCEKCHHKPPKYRGIPFGKCDDCHVDPHRGKMKGTCASCHSETGWSDIGKFRHPGLSLANGHRRVKCKRCHDRGNTRSPSKGRRCFKCHKPVHKAKFGRNCKDCHRSIKWLGLPEKIGRKHHGKTLYPLAGQHRKVKCAKCHLRKLKVSKRYRGLKFDRCDGCHADVHKGEFASKDKGECGACHTVRGFRPTTFGLDDHKSTTFELTGKHVAAPCSRCHKGARPRLDLRVQQKQCAECHENPHGEQFAAEMRKGGCAECHQTQGWDNPKIDHSTWPLTGAHSATDCSACHNPSEADRASGKGATYRGVRRDCEGCHEDYHAGQFRLTKPFRTCSECHDTTKFEIAEFDHDKLTEFDLTGKHRVTKCKQCHPIASLRNGERVARYRLFYRSCASCHANPHREGKTATPASVHEESLIEGMDCLDCHTTDGWKLAPDGGEGFDHAKTGFPLTGTHAKTLCNGCHGTKSKLKRACASCHEDEHKGRMGDACDECHNSDIWEQTTTRRRHSLTRLPLTGMHALLECTSCHIRRTERTWSGVPADCFACHEDDYREDIHPSHEDAAFSRNCGECHRAISWSPAFVDPDTLATLRVDAKRLEHDLQFPISYGKHRNAECDNCHLTLKVPRAVACGGCHAHSASRLRQDHGGKAVARDGAGCIRCHPGGAAR